MIKFSVIIVAYNCYDLIRDCLDSIEKYNDIGDELEVVVVDNGSDGTWQRIKQTENLKCIKSDNKGFGAGNNRGFEISRGEYILFLNPDTLLIEPIFKFAIDKFEKNPKLGWFGVQLIDEKRNNGLSFDFIFKTGIYLTIASRIFRRLNIFLSNKMYLSGADIFVRRNLFERAGMFDENIFMYCEEEDLAYRIKELGYKLSYFKNKKIIHLEGRTSSNNMLKNYQTTLKSKIYLMNKLDLNCNEYFRKEYRLIKVKQKLLKHFIKQEKQLFFCDSLKLLETYI